MSFLPTRRKKGDPPRLNRSVVYFIGADFSESRGALKVGFSNREPNQRLRQMQTGCPLELRLLHSIPGTAKLERAIHQVFSGYLLRGEWFRMDPPGGHCPVRNFVESLIAGECVFELLKRRWKFMEASDDGWLFQLYCRTLKEAAEL